MNPFKATLALAACALITTGCSPDGASSAPGGDPETSNVGGGTGSLGDPLPGLTQDELDAFNRGRLIFTKHFTPEEGLGPHYNATACSSCHNSPLPGGGGRLYRNFYIARAGFTPDPAAMFDLPGLISPVVPAFGTGTHFGAGFTLEGGRAIIPDDIAGIPIAVTQRRAIPLFGVGLFEFISNATILANADPDDADLDGISGRANNDVNGHGRFGVKAQANNIEIFTRQPMQNQMGITSDPFDGSGGVVSLGHMAFQASGGLDDPTTDSDSVPDPEMGTADLGDLIAFSRFLAPPTPKAVLDAGELNGQALFTSLKCDACHIQTLSSSRGPVNAYSDLLLHDMGPTLADNIGFGTPQASTIDPAHNGSEFRTAPLWGISLFGPYIHDGRAKTLDDAILLHGGEAQTIRDNYDALVQQDKDDLI
ncbi:MAG: CxxC motif-containing protein (DUF1111 family), partial [Planctomycetota bacterium]